MKDIKEDSVTLNAVMPCSSPGLQYVVNLTRNNMNFTMKNLSNNIMVLTGLSSGTTYIYCVIAIDTTDMMPVGDPVCGNFTTIIYVNGKYVYTISQMGTVKVLLT